MANEFVARNGIIAQNNSIISGSLTVTNGITGSATTASYVLNAVSSSFSTTSSYSNTSISASYSLSSSYTLTASLAQGIDLTVSSIDTSSYILFSTSSADGSPVFYSTGLRYNPYTNVISASGLIGTASYASSSISASYASTASYVITANTASYVLNAVSASFASTASSINTLYQNVIITGSLTVGSSSLGASENTITLGARDTVNEGGQIGFNAPGGTYTSASFIDNWQNFTRILRGTNASSTGLVAQWNLGTLQMELPGYTSVSSFAGTAAANLAVDSSGKVITVATTGGSVFPYTGNAVITGSLTVTQPIYVPINGAMYFQGGDDAALYDVNITNTMGIYGVQDITVGAIKLGSNGPVLYGSGSRLGIGTTTPLYALDINANTLTGARVYSGSLAVGNIIPSATVGRIDASNDIVAYSTSDINFKENITPINNALEKINKIGGYEFDWKQNEDLIKFHGFSGHDIGVIAQEIEEILPEVVTIRDNGYKAVKYEKIVPLLIEAIKELSFKVKELENNIKTK